MVYRPSVSDAKIIADARELVRRSREILDGSGQSAVGPAGTMQSQTPPLIATPHPAGVEDIVLSIFSCPKTDLKVQHWIKHAATVSDDEYEAVACPACGRLHFVNRKTRKLLGYDR